VEQSVLVNIPGARTSLTAMKGEAAVLLQVHRDNKVIERSVYLLSDASSPRKAFGPVKESASVFLASVRGRSNEKVLVQVIAKEEESVSRSHPLLIRLCHVETEIFSDKNTA